MANNGKLFLWIFVRRNVVNKNISVYMGLLVILISIIFFKGQSLEASDAEDTQKAVSIRNLFDKKYNEWQLWKKSPDFGACSNSNGTVGPWWEAITELGPDALPFIADKMKEDPVLYLAFAQIARVIPKFHMGNPSTDYDKAMQYERDRYSFWWNEDRKHLDINIRKDLNDYKKLKALKKPKKQIDDAIKHIRESYGIFALPYIMPEIEKGDNELAASAWDMLDSVEGDKEKNEKFRLEVKEKVKDTKERRKIILDVASRNGDRIKAIKDLIPAEVPKDKNNNGK